MKPLSKSKFLAGLRCRRLLWLDDHRPVTRGPDAEAEHRMREGIAVEERARAAMGAGVLVASPDFAPEQKIAETRRALESGARLVFEATFSAGGGIVSADILRRVDDGWELIEVKSSNGVKDEHLPDVAVQLFVLRASGLAVPRALVMHLNPECRHPDLSDLFEIEEVTASVEPLLAGIPGELAAMQATLGGPEPAAVLGMYCKRPSRCVRFDECWHALPEHHVHTLYQIRWPSVEKHLRAGRDTVDKLEEDDTKVVPAKRQIRAVRAGRRVVEPGLAAALGALREPVAWLDFETIAPAIPVWPDCGPHDKVPVQFSVHWTGREDRETRAHLAAGSGDPRPALAESLVRACEGAATVVAYYASFEKECLDLLAAAVPAHADALLAIKERIVDLLPIVRDHVYDPAFHGSFSLKKVLGPLAGGRYDDLEVQEGGSASVLLAQLLLEPSRIGDPAAQAALRRDLLRYCERDTEAMVRLADALRAMA